MNFYFSSDTSEHSEYKIVYERISKNSVMVNIETQIRGKACDGLYHLMLRQENRIPIDICGSGKKEEIEYISFLIKRSEVIKGFPSLDKVSHSEHLKICFPECDPIHNRYINQTLSSVSAYYDNDTFIYLFDYAQEELHEFTICTGCSILLNEQNSLRGVILYHVNGFGNFMKCYTERAVDKHPKIW